MVHAVGSLSNIDWDKKYNSPTALAHALKLEFDRSLGAKNVCSDHAQVTSFAQLCNVY